MKNKILVLLLAFILGISSLHAGKNEELKVLESAKTLKDLLHLPENAIPPILFKEAHAIAIIPSTYKVGFIFGGQYGNAGQTWPQTSTVTMTTRPQLLVNSVRIQTLYGIDTAVDFHHHHLAKVVSEERGVHRG